MAEIDHYLTSLSEVIMKNVSVLLLSAFLFNSPAFAKIVVQKNKVFIEGDGNRTPLSLVNEMIKKKEISKLKLYGAGKANVISFAKKGEKEKLYSVDKKGFVYAIDPFSKYEVKKVDDKGLVQFKEVPGKSYKITSQGFFIH